MYQIGTKIPAEPHKNIIGIKKTV